MINWALRVRCCDRYGHKAYNGRCPRCSQVLRMGVAEGGYDGMVEAMFYEYRLLVVHEVFRPSRFFAALRRLTPPS